jgi:hypothetical protein
MFDRPVVVLSHPSRTEYVTREVHEHRAPTDKSVELLREMEQKARDQVIEAVHVGNATFDCVLHTMKHCIDGSTEMLAVFSMNGRKMTVSHRDQDWRCDKQAMVEALRDKMATEIATTVLIPALERAKL